MAKPGGVEGLLTQTRANDGVAGVSSDDDRRMDGWIQG